MVAFHCSTLPWFITWPFLAFFAFGAYLQVFHTQEMKKLTDDLPGRNWSLRAIRRLGIVNLFIVVPLLLWALVHVATTSPECTP